MSTTEQSRAIEPADEDAPARSGAGAIPVLSSRAARPWFLAPDEGDGQFKPRWHAGFRLFFISVWLVYLIPTLERAWGAPKPGARIVGVLAVLAFAGLYVSTFVMIRRIRVGFLVEPRRRLSWGLVGLGIVLIMVALPAAGETVLAMTMYLAIIIMFLLPPRWAVMLVLIDAISVAVLSNVVPGWTSQDQLAVQILVTALAIWGIIQMLQRNNQLAQAREEITSLAVSQERMRFSRDLHDILGHTLTVITLKTELAGRLIRTDPVRAEHEITEVERLARTALADVRATVAGYRDVSLAVELASARTALDAAGIEADLAGTVDDVPAERRELFGWAVREGVTNVVRHSGAQRCRVSVEHRLVQIADDGRGPGRCLSEQPTVQAGLNGGGMPRQTHGSAAGHGLAGLRERAEAVGAHLSVGRADEGGFLLQVAW